MKKAQTKKIRTIPNNQKWSIAAGIEFMTIKFTVIEILNYIVKTGVLKNFSVEIFERIFIFLFKHKLC